jgi:hypothetical protein
MKNKTIILAVILCIFVCGCAAWQLVPTQYKWRYANFEATLPAGWMRLNYSTDSLFLTKDGELLQNIRIFRYRIGKDKELPISKKKFTEEMLLQEISELIINEMSLDQNRHNFKITENIPVALSGKDGFKLEYKFNTSDDLKLKTILYGYKENKYIYLIQYQAAEQHYFDKDLEVFKKFINDFKILEQ